MVAGRPGWTNNNCESVNNVVKQYTQWRPQQLPDLISTLQDLVRSQFTHADRALCGRGEMILHRAYAKHRLTVDAWKAMTVAQRQKQSTACFYQTVKEPSSTSSDGTVTVPTTPGAGQKLHQRKRPRNERVTKPPAKSARLDNKAAANISDKDTDNDD